MFSSATHSTPTATRSNSNSNSNSNRAIMVASVFFDLPDVLKISILDAWLALPAGHDSHSEFLFTAVRGYPTIQKDFARLLQSPECVFHCLINDRNGYRLPWMIEHNIKASKLKMYQKHLQDYDTLFRYFGPTLRNLELQLQCGELNNDYNVEAYTKVRHIKNEEAMYECFRHCPYLEQLTVDCFKASGERSWMVCLPDRFATVFNMLPHLKVMKFEACVDISEAVVNAMCRAPNLTEICIGGNSKFATGAFAHAVPNLRVQKVHTSSVGFCALFPNLQEVHLYERPSADVAILAASCKHIKFAYFTLTDLMDMTTAETVCNNWKSVHTLICKTSYSARPLVEDTTIMFLKECSSLKVYNVHKNLHSRPPVAAPIPSVTYPPLYTGSKLLDIAVNCCSERVLHAIVAHCPYLSNLRLHGTTYDYSDTSGLDSLHLLNNSSVKYLCISGYTLLTDAHICLLHTIHTLVLVDTRCVRSTGIVSFAEGCKSLRELHLYTMRGCDVDVCCDVMEVCPSLQTITYHCDVSAPLDSRAKQLVAVAQKMARKLYPHVKTFKIC